MHARARVRFCVVSYWGCVGRADPRRARCYTDSDNELSDAGKADVRAALARVSNVYT